MIKIVHDSSSGGNFSSKCSASVLVGLCDFRFFQDSVRLNARLSGLASPDKDFTSVDSSKSDDAPNGLKELYGILSSDPEYSQKSLASRISKNDRNFFLKEA